MVTLSWKMLCLLFVIFEVRHTFITTKKNIFFDILQEKIFSDTVARKNLLCNCKKDLFCQ
jgi:hypothetical protein